MENRAIIFRPVSLGVEWKFYRDEGEWGKFKDVCRDFIKNTFETSLILILRNL